MRDLLRAVAFDAAEQRRAVVVAQLVVQLALQALQLATQRQLGARRQLRRDLRLRAAQDERAQARERASSIACGSRRAAAPL